MVPLSLALTILAFALAFVTGNPVNVNDNKREVDPALCPQAKATYKGHHQGHVWPDLKGRVDQHGSPFSFETFTTLTVPAQSASVTGGIDTPTTAYLDPPISAYSPHFIPRPSPHHSISHSHDERDINHHIASPFAGRENPINPPFIVVPTPTFTPTPTTNPTESTPCITTFIALQSPYQTHRRKWVWTSTATETMEFDCHGCSLSVSTKPFGFGPDHSFHGTKTIRSAITVMTQACLPSPT